MKARTKTILAALAALLSLLATAAPAAETADRQVKFRISAQSLDSALVEFSQQSGLQLVVTSETVRGKSTQGVKGSLKPTEALAVLLQGLGLEYTVVNPRSLAIRIAHPNGDDGSGARTQADSPGRSMRLVSAGEKTGSQLQTQTLDGTPEASSGIPEILVRGNRSINTDIRRTEDDPQPYVVFDSAEIQRSQATNVEEFLRTRLPMNTAFSSAGQVPGTATTTSSINLRGLGANQTLILIDGRRMPSNTSLLGTPAPSQPDVNGIPLAAIERIEVLPSTAGGIYGGSATGGVVNIILRKDYHGLELKALYTNTFDTDTAGRRLDASAGFSLEGGRTQVMVSATYSDTNNLMVGDRDLNERAVALQLKNNPARITGTTAPPLGATVNIRSVSGNLVLDSEYGGVALGSDITHVPLGYAGPASDDGAGLVAGAGRYNLDLPAGVLGATRGLVAAPAMESALLNIRRDLGKGLEVFADFFVLIDPSVNHDNYFSP